jgi:hypothetical protein
MAFAGAIWSVWARAWPGRASPKHRCRLHGRVRRITIDLDPTDDPTHGQQELSFFNGHYDTACYLPLVATLTFDDEPLQNLAGIVPATGQCRGPCPFRTRALRSQPFWIRLRSASRSPATSSAIREALTAATMICPISVWTSLKMPRVFIFCVCRWLSSVGVT